MTIADAIPEPDWAELFRQAQDNASPLPRYMVRDDAFEHVLRSWRRHHYTEVKGCPKCRIQLPEESEFCPRCRGEPQMVKRSAEAIDGIIALAKLGVMPPKSLRPDPHDHQKCIGEDDHRLFPGEQHDDHCWLVIAGEAWAIRAIEDRMLHLWMGWEPDLEYKTVDLNKVKWEAYCEKASAWLRAAYPTDTE